MQISLQVLIIILFFFIVAIVIIAFTISSGKDIFSNAADFINRLSQKFLESFKIKSG